MSSEGAPSVNHISPIVIYDPVLATSRYATGTVLTNSTPQHVAVVDGSGNQITSFGGGTQYTEGDTDATITGNAMMMEGAGNALAPAQGTTTDGLLVNLGANNDVTVTGNVAVTIAQDVMLGTDFSSVFGTSSLILATQADDVDNASDGVQTTSFSYMFDGTTWDRVRGDATNGLLVNLGANNDVTVTGSVTANAGTNLNTSALLTTTAFEAVFGTAGVADSQVLTVQGITSMTPLLATVTATNLDIRDLTSVSDSVSVLQATASNLNATVVGTGTFAVQDATAQASLSVMDDWDNTASDGASVSGDVAHDGVDAGEPVKIGGKATDVGTGITVANNDRTNGAFLRNGIQLVLGGAHDIISKNLNVTDADGAQTDVALVTVSAGTAIVVTKASVMLDSATTATGGVAVRIGFGTANTPAADSAGIILAHPGIAAGSGVVEGNGAGIIGIGASNEDLRLTCEDPAGGNIDIIITYFTIAIG